MYKSKNKFDYENAEVGLRTFRAPSIVTREISFLMAAIATQQPEEQSKESQQEKLNSPGSCEIILFSERLYC